MEVNSNSIDFVNTGQGKLVQRRIETPSGASRKQVRCDFFLQQEVRQSER